MKKNTALLITAVATLALVLGLTPALAQTAPSTTPPPATQNHERHPAIRAAIRALEKAKEDLKAANHDFGGHRATALEECDKAIAQLKLALQYDKN